MKLKNAFFTFSFFAFIFISCSDSNDKEFGTLELTIKGTYGGKALISGASYNYFNKGTIELTKSEFFMSTSRLLSESGVVALKDVDYIALTDKQVDSASAENGIKLTFTKIPAKEYTGLSFILGLSAEQNATKPVDYLPTEPLGEGTHYWAGWNSYIFSKTEGIFNDGANNFSFSYHSGFDDAKRTVSLLKDFEVLANQTSRITMILEHEELFRSGSNGLDIPANPQIHNKSDVMNQMMDRYAAAFSLK